jgi:RNA polymerase sigma-70 factor (ECF subfamily)
MRDTKAFEELCKRFGPKLERFCVRMLHDAALAEDVAQETLLRLWQHADSFDEDRDPSSWLYTVARNLCIETLRARARTVAMATLPEHAGDDDPGDRVAADDERSIVRKVLAEMPARQREMLLL